jgi:hypothetical protein
MGYCTEHQRLLLAPSHLTCGRHFRKDLTASAAAQERQIHERHFTPSAVVRITEKTRPANGGYTSSLKRDFARLAADPVSEAVLDYGKLPSKMASLAQLKPLDGVRPELALLSLGRAYVNRCVVRGGRWTSGIHVLWWTRRRLLTDPAVGVGDFRVESPLPLERQVELAKWSLVMMRLVLISDVGSYADPRDAVHRLARLAELAAEKTGELGSRRLLAWIKREGLGYLDRALPEKRYERLSAELRNHPSADG